MLKALVVLGLFFILLDVCVCPNPAVNMMLDEVYTGNAHANDVNSGNYPSYKLLLDLEENDLSKEVTVTCYAKWDSETQQTGPFALLYVSNSSSPYENPMYSTSFPNNTIVLPPAPEYAEGQGQARWYIGVIMDTNIQGNNETVLQYWISSNNIRSIDINEHIVRDGMFQIQETIPIGKRPYFTFEPPVDDSVYTLVVQLCSVTEDSITSNPNGIFYPTIYWNRYNDYLSNGDTTYEYGCGINGINGALFFRDPSNYTDNTMFYACPTYLSINSAFTDIMFGVDISRFWYFPPLNGTIDIKINLYESDPLIPPFETANNDNPSYIERAKIEFDEKLGKDNDLKLQFQLVTGEDRDKVMYGFFTDAADPPDVRADTARSKIFSNACYLVKNEDKYLWTSKWYTIDELNDYNNETDLAHFHMKGFFDEVGKPEQNAYHINIVAQVLNDGHSAYSFEKIPDYFGYNDSSSSSSSNGINGWFIALYVLVALVILALVILIPIAVFIYTKRRSYNVIQD
eukprot:TRINITY_DN13_c2_g1_i1.p1 TRINITY_DN13_c2_g1~~TRINITY_DN13_c2_g1_i1.p1  ORF type:complete len:514 (-),score=157.62 TRINITY_DN13_c2_g1_i1:67-1608(-)